MIRKLNPLNWSPLQVLGILGIIALTQGILTPEQLGSVIRHGAEFGFEAVRGFAAGLGLGL